MNVASLELSKELYELSGWWDDGLEKYDEHGPEFGTVRWGAIPAYDLGYLLRKLPKYLLLESDGRKTDCRLEISPQGFNSKGASQWCFTYQNQPGEIEILECADTPEDAAAKLCIELFKQGVLTHE